MGKSLVSCFFETQCTHDPLLPMFRDLCVCVMVTTETLAETEELIDMLFVVWTIGTRNP